MNRSPLVFILPILLISLFTASVAWGGNTYAPATFGQGMTPLSSPTTIWPPTQNYTQGSFTKGMTQLGSPTYIWNGATTSADDVSAQVTLPFSFQYYGVTYTSVWVGSNGFITFAQAGSTSLGNTVIPSTGTPNAYIAFCWDDLKVNVGTSASVSHQTQGTTPTRTWTVQYYRIQRYSNSGYITGQIVLYETSNIIELHYDTGNQNWVSVSATIGMENTGGTAGLGGPNTGSTNSTVPNVNYRFSPQSPVFDDAATTINLPFSFAFFGNTYVQVHVSTNGFLSFANTAVTDATNDTLPTAQAPNDIIALFWDDLLVDSNGLKDTVSHQTLGVAPNRTFTVQWLGVTRSGQTLSELSGQIVLYEMSHRIELHYDTTSGNNNWVGVTATIGIEDSTGVNAYGGPNTNNNNASCPAVNYRWDPITTHNLQVTSAQGTPTPAVGTHLYNNGTAVTCNSNSPASGGPGLRYRCTGWTGTGSVPPTGSATSVTFTITQASTIIWNWVTEIQLTLNTVPAGGGNPTSVPAGPWIQPGTLVQVNANPNGGFIFNNWTGGISSINNPETFTMNNPTTITANYILSSPLTLTVSGNPSNYGNPTPAYGAHGYSAGNNITCSVTSPASGPAGTRYVCTGWTGTGDVPASGAGTSTSFTINQISTITWNWVVEYQLTTVDNPAAGGSITPSPAGPWYPSGQSVQVTANPNAGFNFTNWTGAITSAVNPDSFTITAPSTVTANYTAIQRTFTVVSAQGSPVPGVGAHNYNHGSAVSCSVTSPVSGGAGTRYVCTGWTGTGDVPLTGTSTSVNFNITQNSSITWNWQTEYETTLVSNPPSGGSIVPNPTGGWYASGTPVSFQANPNGGYSFQSWSTGLSGATNPDSLTVTAPVTITADFLAQGPSLTVISAQGSPTPPVGTQAYLPATVVQCTAPSPASGGPGIRFICTGWTGTGDVPASGTGNSVSVTMNNESTITWYWIAEYHITTSIVPPAAGTAVVTPAGPWFGANTTVNLTATPNTGYRFIAWSGGVQTAQNPASVLIDGPKLITGNFITDVALGIHAGPANPASSQELDNATGVSMLQLAMTAGTAEAVNVSDVRVSVTGSSDEAVTVAGVNLYRDVNGDGAYSVAVDQVLSALPPPTFPINEGNILFTLSPAIQIPAGGVVYLLCTFDLIASPGDDFQAQIAASGDVSAVSVATSTPLTPIGAPVVGGVKTAASAGTTGSLEIVGGPNGPGATIVAPGSTGVPMMQLILRASSLEGATVTDIAFTASGSGDDGADVAQVSLYDDTNGDGAVDGGDVLLGSSGLYTGDDGKVSFSGLSESIGAGGQTTWLVVHDYAAGVTSGSFSVQIASGTDILVTGNTSASALSVSGPPLAGGLITIGVPPVTTPTTGDYKGFAGGCGGPAVGGLLPLLPLLPFGLALWFFSRGRRRRRD